MPVHVHLVARFGQRLLQDQRQRSEAQIGAHDPSAHAEMVGNYRLPETTLYVTLEPCVMCAGAIVHARVKRLVFAAADPKASAVESVYDIIARPQLNHGVEWSGGRLRILLQVREMWPTTGCQFLELTSWL